jgi:hypothetical protein
MPKGIRNPREDAMLEGGGAGSGSIKGTKWSSMPSFRGNANVIDDIKKITSDTSNLKGAAKQAKEEAAQRAVKRMGVRAAAAGAGAASLKAMRTAEAESPSTEQDDYEMDGAASIDMNMPGGFAGKGMKQGGMTASKRADGIAQRGKTKGRMC